ncbi:uncharacterized protein EDB91DRAFT_230449 [Suillus paluster]|uniref:uncharacterized protein n=1 Tax=Suillus paluster TaxID=48578 RepID=UPI001B88430A|nr:uncharacterized protein EDB91DRAFT_230449 [Suillus paluster]KAG1743167.1 hypothetical protein EDB91DRAFT_230449 [Suillus paluster]
MRLRRITDSFSTAWSRGYIKRSMVVYLARTSPFYISPSYHPSNILKRSQLVTDNQFEYYLQLFFASSVGVIYDWALTFGQEVELVWKKRWSLMTVLCLSVRYSGNTLRCHQYAEQSSVTLADRCSRIIYTINWMHVVANAMLGVIMIARLHAMHQRSRKMFIFLIVIFLAVNIPCGVIAGIDTMYVSGGTTMTTIAFEERVHMSTGSDM